MKVGLIDFSLLPLALTKLFSPMRVSDRAVGADDREHIAEDAESWKRFSSPASR